MFTNGPVLLLFVAVGGFVKLVLTDVLVGSIRPILFWPSYTGAAAAVVVVVVVVVVGVVCSCCRFCDSCWPFLLLLILLK